MLDLTPDKLLLVALIVVPGVIASQTYSLWVPSARKDWNNALAEVVTYGLLNFGLWFPLISSRANADFAVNNPWSAVVEFLLVCFVSPASLSTAWFWCRKKILHKIGMDHPTRTAWDFLMRENKRFFAICHLKDGRKIAGLFSGRSFASLSPEEQDLYCECQYKLLENGQGEDVFDVSPIQDTAGFYIKVKDCQHIELFVAEVREDERDATQVRETGATSPAGTAADGGGAGTVQQGHPG